MRKHLVNQAEYIKNIIENCSAASLLQGNAIFSKDGKSVWFSAATQISETIGDDFRTINTVYAYEDGSQLVKRMDLFTDTISYFTNEGREFI